jgi:ribonuclease P protein subunit RPR2
MGKEKPPRKKGVPNRHLHARTTFLYQAATYLTLHPSAGNSNSSAAELEATEPASTDKGHSPLALQLGAHLWSVSRKAQTRLSSDLKRSICKSCNAILVPGETATHSLENKSKGGKKAWADVFEVTCHVCGTKKRFPVGATRQLRKAQRLAKGDDCLIKEDVSSVGQSTTPAMLTGTEKTSSSS